MPTAYTYNGTAYELVLADTAHKKGYYKKKGITSNSAFLVVTFADTSFSPDSAKAEEKVPDTTDTAYNFIPGAYASVSGGDMNVASGNYATVAGGEKNLASGFNSAVLGGYFNEAAETYSTVMGGQFALASGWVSTASGGYQNSATGSYTSVYGGYANVASSIDSRNMAASVFGGQQNEASAYVAVATGGILNKASGAYSMASGGRMNEASGRAAAIFGGYSNAASGMLATAVGGYGSVVQGEYSTGVAGGSTGAEASDALAAGAGSVVTAANGTAIGYQATADEAGTVSFGHDAGDVSGYEKDDGGNWVAKTYGEGEAFYNRLVKVGYGIEGHDAATVAQLPEVELKEGEANLTLVTKENAGTDDEESVTGKNRYTLSLASSLTGIASISNGTAKIALSSADGSVSVNGITVTSGNKITNVTAGTDGTDAVNVSQLMKALESVQSNIIAGDNIAITEKEIDGKTYKVISAAGVTSGDKVIDVTPGSGSGSGSSGTAGDTGTSTNPAGNYTVTSKTEFKGDTGSTVTVGGSETASSVLTVKGGAAGDLTDGNIGVVGDASDGSLTVKLAKDLKGLDTVEANAISATTVKAGDTTVSTEGVAIKDGPSFTKTNIDAAGNQIHNVAAGTADTDAVNVAQLKAVSQQASAHNTVAAGDNLTLSTSTNAAGGTEYKVSLAKELKGLDSVEAKTVTASTVNATDVNATTLKAGDTTVNTAGVTIANGPSFTKTNTDAAGNQIHGVAAGTADTDAVNVSQLKASENRSNTRINELGKRINQVSSENRAGIASAMAMAALGQPIHSGKSMLSAGASYYKGQSGIAVGVSSVSDSGSWLVKFAGSGNTEGDFGVAGSVNYEW